MLTMENALTYGPAMLALTPQQRAFVEAYIAQGGENASEAYRAAYPNAVDQRGVRVGAHRLHKNPKIWAAIKEESNRLFEDMGPMATSRTMALLMNPEHPEHWKAVKWVQETQGRVAVQRT